MISTVRNFLPLVFECSFQGTGIPLVWLRTQVSVASFSTDRVDRGTHECFHDAFHANVSLTKNTNDTILNYI